jgi:hypothetical protein
MGYKYSIILLVLFDFAVLAFGVQSQLSSANHGDFRWLESSSDTEGSRYSKRPLQQLSLQTYAGMQSIHPNYTIDIK